MTRGYFLVSARDYEAYILPAGALEGLPPTGPELEEALAGLDMEEGVRIDVRHSATERTGEGEVIVRGEAWPEVLVGLGMAARRLVEREVYTEIQPDSWQLSGESK